MNKNIISVKDLYIAGKMIAFIKGNRSVNSKNISRKKKSFEKFGMNLVPLMYVDGQKAVNEGLPSPDEAADFYLYAVEHLEHHGYRQYEISNFAKPGYEGRHNLIYWDCGDYLGLGPAAHSCMGGRRFYYPADTEAFLNDKAAPVMDGGCGAEDYLILQLRLRKGLDLAAYKARYGKEFSTAQLAFVKNCVKSGYATFDGSTLALTPAGLIVQNSILAELL